MPVCDVKRIVTKYFTLAMLILALLLFSKESTKALFVPSRVPVNGAQQPTVTKVDQEGAPLRIVDTFIETPGPEKTVIRVMVQNQSAKSIRALAIAADARVDFLNLSGRVSILLPTQTKTFDTVYTGDGRPKKVTLSVDFVEFTDGTTWGTDMGNSRDRLAGQREGAKAEKRRLRNLLNAKGRQALISLLDGDVSDSLESSSAAGHSQEWQQGYHGGAAAIRHRVRQALQNQSQVEIELNKPYDTSEDNNQ